MNKTKSILFSIIWTVTILIFPISSGIIAVVFELDQIFTFVIQGAFMLVSIIIPLSYIKIKKCSFAEYGFRMIEKNSSKEVLFFIPFFLIILPRLVMGVDFQNVQYVFALLFFTLCVGVAEEIYFRGIIYKLLKNAFISPAVIISISAVIFGIGHGASIIGTGDIIATILQVINAFLFGAVATETIFIIKSLYPVMIFHFIYNFSNYISVATGTTEIICICVQVVITIITAIILGLNVNRVNKTKYKTSDTEKTL